MTILHVIPSVNPAGGGPIEGVKQLSSVLIPQGHRVEIASLDDPAAPWVKECPVATHPLGPAKGTYSLAPGAVDWIRSNAPHYDAVVVEGLWQYHSFATWRALRGRSTPYFVFTHGMLDPWFNKAYPLKRLKKALYWPWAEYRVLRDAKAVLFTCEEERLLARRSFRPYRVNEKVVGYGTARPQVDFDAARATFLGQNPGLEGRRILLFLSRIHRKKGVDLLIEAFATVFGKDDRFRLVVAGPDQQGLVSGLVARSGELGIGDRVVWPGMLQGESKWGAFAAAEAFVLPSHQENFGIVVAEALACGRPVLISDKVNIWREVSECGAGYVEPDDLEGTTRLLRRWAGTGEEDRSALSERATACFERKFEVKMAAANFLRAVGGDL